MDTNLRQNDFTATLSQKNQVLLTKNGANFEDLLIHFLTFLEKDYAHGELSIIDNQNGHLVYQGRKATCYD